MKKQFSQLLVATIRLHLQGYENVNANSLTAGTMLDHPASAPLRIHGMHPVWKMTFTFS